MKKFFKDFRDFAVQGNVIDLAVGVMIGGAFGKIVSSLVSDLFMPLIGLLMGAVSFDSLYIPLKGGHYANVTEALASGEPILNIGAFITNVIDFLIIALCVFIFVRLIMKVMPKKPAAPAVPTRVCPYCKTTIDGRATRCPNCTSEVAPTVEDAATA